eukprot:TRINITY_DN1230_c0_g4_i3.p1 TRINITY_DN1230_c0_g4~~TRINITY_DN1230_c0_g4_i3.p1  ORF type:complete len:390 (-),score=116.59 TRINITY_DN1230_c0_g4_i3:190-1359(-)
MAHLDKKSLAQLETFVKFIKSHPEALHTPELKFFKEYLQSLKAVIPPIKTEEPEIEEVDEETLPDQPTSTSSSTSSTSSHHTEPPKHHPEPEEEPEPEQEPDEHVVKPDTGYESIEMGDKSKMVSEDEEGDAFSLMGQARKQAREGNHTAAIEKLTEAIKINPQGSALFATRAESFLELKRPNAAIKDCNRALELNPDSGKALKTRGKARRLLGKYGEAFYDLQQGNLLDWDESTDAVIKEIKERAEKAIARQRKQEEKKRLDDLKREAAEKRRRQQEEEDLHNRASAGAGGFPGGGGPGGMDALSALLGQLTKDPEVAALLKNPDTLKKLNEFLMEGGKHADDPAIKKIMEVLQRKVPGAGGAAGHGGHGGHSHPHPHPHPTGTDDLD